MEKSKPSYIKYDPTFIDVSPPQSPIVDIIQSEYIYTDSIQFPMNEIPSKYDEIYTNEYLVTPIYEHESIYSNIEVKQNRHERRREQALRKSQARKTKRF